MERYEDLAECRQDVNDELKAVLLKLVPKRSMRHYGIYLHGP